MRRMIQATPVTLDNAAVQDLKGRLRGRLIEPSDPDYEAARKVYNGMIDRRPQLIAQCVDVADGMAAVNFAREQQLPLAGRGGGPNGPGVGTVDDGLVIDLSQMKGVRVGPPHPTARIEGGALGGQADQA